MQKSRGTDAHRRLLDLLITARKQTGQTQAQLAARLGRPQSFVAKYENGEHRLDLIEFLSVMRAVDADPVEAVRELQVIVERGPGALDGRERGS